MPRAVAMEQDAAGPGTFSANIGRAQLVLGRALLAHSVNKRPANP
jgi:hypothetical protein